MRPRKIVLATAFGGAALAAAGVARADTVQGLYVGAGAGYELPRDMTATVDAVPGAGGVEASAPMRVRWEGGYDVDTALGWGLGNGLRVELEESYRANSQIHGGGQQTELGVMGNVLYDINFGADWITPYIGLGGGYESVSWHHVSGQASGIEAASPSAVNVGQTVGGFAYQIIVGVALPIASVPGLSVTAEYRYQSLAAARVYKASVSAPGGPVGVTRIHADDAADQSVMLGLRYEFDGTDKDGPVDRPPPAPTRAPPPVASVETASAPAPPARTYLVFFDWNSAELSPRAHEIIAEAVRNSSRLTYTRIEVTGSADRTGTERANQAISLRRARVVAAELERFGVPSAEIDIHAVGDTQLPVPTAPGVRLRENRRVEIVYR